MDRLFQHPSDQYTFPSSFEDPAKTFACLHSAALRAKDSDSHADKFDGWNVYNEEAEFARQGIQGSQTWRLVDNEKYELVPTYPRRFIVPAKLNDNDLKEVAQYRSRGRLPVVTWVHPKGCSMSRSSQPLAGIKSKRCAADEILINMYRESGSNMRERKGKAFFIIDARSWQSAMANKVGRGKGAEKASTYGANTHTEFRDIGNIHTMRDSINILSEIASPTGIENGDTNYLSRLGSSGWLKHIQLVLSGSLRVVECMEKMECSVLLHCSDGWDRTAQLGATAQILMDPFYRTLKGLAVLIEKEWCSFGHKFRDRLNHGAAFKSKSERSPVFLQWIDALWQLTIQYPTAFEFSESALIFILDNIYSCRFGNFLDNCEKERHERKRKTTTESIWSHVLSDEHIKEFTNSEYVPTRATLWPSVNPRRIRIWERYYFRWDPSLWPVMPMKKTTRETACARMRVERCDGETNTCS